MTTKYVKNHKSLFMLCSIFMLCFLFANIFISITVFHFVTVERLDLIDKFWGSASIEQKQLCKDKNMTYVELKTFTTYKCADNISGAITEFVIFKRLRGNR